MPAMLVVAVYSSSFGPPLTVTVTSGSAPPLTVTATSIPAVRSMMPSNSTVAVSLSATVTFSEVTSKPYSSASKPEIATE